MGEGTLGVPVDTERGTGGSTDIDIPLNFTTLRTTFGTEGHHHNLSSCIRIVHTVLDISTYSINSSTYRYIPHSPIDRTGN